jgi:hypothetical protein
MEPPQKSKQNSLRSRNTAMLSVPAANHLAKIGAHTPGYAIDDHRSMQCGKYWSLFVHH